MSEYNAAKTMTDLQFVENLTECQITGTTFASGAILSADGAHRYRLWRSWGPGHRLGFIMLNPSTADATEDDPTIRKCRGFAERLGYKGIDVVNLFSYRATKPADLKAAGWPDGGAENIRHIAAVMYEASVRGEPVVCAWGAHARAPQARGRASIIMRSATVERVQLKALRMLADGIPEHPLMLPYECVPSPF
jgi:hypothetical protein